MKISSNFLDYFSYFDLDGTVKKIIIYSLNNGKHFGTQHRQIQKVFYEFQRTINADIQFSVLGKCTVYDSNTMV